MLQWGVKEEEREELRGVRVGREFRGENVRMRGYIGYHRRHLEDALQDYIGCRISWFRRGIRGKMVY